MTYDGYTAVREYHTINPVDGEKHGGRWVVRDENGQYVDAGAYRFDLRIKWPGVEIIGD